jgi:hypothetical protein
MRRTCTMMDTPEKALQGKRIKTTIKSEIQKHTMEF